jgi:hypothetical protein
MIHRVPKVRRVAHHLILRATLVLATIVAPAARAQATYPDRSTRAGRASVVAPWDTVRLRVGDKVAVRGVLTAVDSAGLWISPRIGRDSVLYAYSGISSAEVRRGSRGRGPGPLVKGALIGTSIGIGLVIPALLTEKRERGVLAIVGIFLTGVTTLVGGLAGGIVSLTPTDRWEPFNPVTLRVSLPPSSGTAGT